MVRCPECGGFNVMERVYYGEDVVYNQYESVHVRSYWCEDCGCEWDEVTEVRIEITKHGDKYTGEEVEVA